MALDPEIAEANPAVLVASALHLLTCSALHGVSIAKSRSLVMQLTALADKPDTEPLLRRACTELARAWYQHAVELSHDRVFDEAAPVNTQAFH